MANKLFAGLKTQYKVVASYAKAGWEKITPEKPPEPPAGPQSIGIVLQAELLEIEESRRTRLIGFSEQQRIGDIERIEELLHARDKVADAGVHTEGKKSAGSEDAVHAGGTAHPLPVPEPIAKKVDNDLVGVCFSGGGIRSATFNLGVTTALAKKGYLRQIDYLSTVSGGGYIGSWLTAWIKREGAREGGGCKYVEDVLSGRLGNLLAEYPQGGDAAPPGAGAAETPYLRYTEPDHVRFLRKYSNYLAPRTGLLSTDLWALLAVYLRNVILNLALLIAVGALILGLPLLGVRYGWHLAGKDLQGTLIWVIRGLLVLAMGALAYSFASFSRDVQPRFKLARSIINRPGLWVTFPLLLAAACMTYVLTPSLMEKLHCVLTSARPSVQNPLLAGWLTTRLPDWISTSAVFQWLNALPARSGHAEMTGWVMEGAFWYTIIWVVGSFAAQLFEVLSGWNIKGERSHETELRAQGFWQKIISKVQARWQMLRSLNWKVLIGRGHGPKPIASSVVVFLTAAVLSGALGGLLLYAFGLLLQYLPQALWQSLNSREPIVQAYANLALWIILGPPLLLWTVALVSVLHVGLLGRSFPDAKREWLSRLCAMLALTAAGWAVLTGLALYGPVVFKFLFLSDWASRSWGRVLKWIVASGWVTATVGGVIGGNKSKNTTQSTNESTGMLLKLAPPVFILGLLLLLSWGLDWYLRSSPVCDNPAAVNGPSTEQYNSMIDKTSGAGSMGEFVVRFGELMRRVTPPSARAAMDHVGTDHWLYAARYLQPSSTDVRNLLIALALIVLLLSRCLDVNEFSIHLLYRNRLARCYLGASRDKRRPQPFTGFDVDDDIPVASLRVKPYLPGLDNNPDLEKLYDGPYHIVCTALNLVSGKELAWQTRKARSFIYSPLYCGYDLFIPEEDGGKGHEGSRSMNKDGDRGNKLGTSAYRRTEWFSGYPGPYLGNALAISGAAASPNMGYHSSPALTFLMAVFNVRLGWWAGNTRHNSTWNVFGPRLALYLGLELVGRTDDENKFVYLSDGGHFENLGLYELVRRKCRYIIASDGGCDPDYSFGDLGNAIQKCRRDLGADILINVNKLRPKSGERLSESHYALGKIKYSDGSEGTLLYLKSSLTKTDRQDVQSFASKTKAFPHDTTANQFFNEDRFESYRALGEDAFDSVVNDMTEKLRDANSTIGAGPVTLAGLFAALERVYSSS